MTTSNRENQTMKNMKGKTTTPAYKARMVRKWEASGMTAVQFCKKHGLALSSFYHWSSEAGGKRPRTKKESKGEFVALSAKALTTPHHGLNGHMKLERNGLTITVSADNEQGVRTAMRMLKEEAA